MKTRDCPAKHDTLVYCRFDVGPAWPKIKSHWVHLIRFVEIGTGLVVHVYPHKPHSDYLLVRNRHARRCTGVGLRLGSVKDGCQVLFHYYIDVLCMLGQQGSSQSCLLCNRLLYRSIFCQVHEYVESLTKNCVVSTTSPI